MNCKPKKNPFIGIIGIIFSQQLIGLSIVEKVYSQEFQQKLQIPLDKGSIKFPTGKNRGQPETTSGGGARLMRRVDPTQESSSSSCVVASKDGLSLNVLTPGYANLATTTSLTPTLYFYIPWTQAALGELLLTDENGRDTIYQTVFMLPNQPGIAKLTLKPQKNLLPGKKYKWSLRIICNRHYRDRDILIVGRLEYQQLDKSALQYLETKDPLERAKFYARRGYWLDTLENAAELRSQQPQEWTELLRSVGLRALSTKPFIDCCKPNPPNL